MKGLRLSVDRRVPARFRITGRLPVAARAVAVPLIAALLSVACAALTPGGGRGTRSGEGAPAGDAERPVPALSPRKALKEARAALGNDDPKDALQFYEMALAGDPLPDPTRAEALYGAGMIRLGNDPDLRDEGRARELLREFLSVYPNHERRHEARLALSLLGEIEAARAATEIQRAEISRREFACAEEKRKLTASITAAEEGAASLRPENESLKAEIKTLHVEAQALRAEIQKRDETLQKVKEAVVGKKSRR